MVDLNAQLAVGDLLLVISGYQVERKTAGPYQMMQAMTLAEMRDAYKMAWRMSDELRMGADVDDLPDSDRYADWLVKVGIIAPAPHVIVDAVKDLGFDP